ncbi:hypothetical protein L9F63_026914, partial [Diploptera punctata]
MNILSSSRKIISDCGKSSETGVLRRSRLVTCVKNSVMQRVVPMLQINGSKISALNGVLEIERTDGANFTLESGTRIGKSRRDGDNVDEEPEVTLDEIENTEPQELMADFENFSKKLTFRVKVLPGLILKMGRNSGGFNFGMELDQKDFEDLQV